MTKWAIGISALMIASLLAACHSGKASQANAIPDTLRVGTIYGPTSYFLYKNDEMGYDYELIARFAADKGAVLQMTIAPNIDTLIAMLDDRRIDVIAYEVPVTAEFNKRLRHCGKSSVNHQVLVQLKSDTSKLLTDAVQLAGHDVWVEKGSKYEYRLRNLNNEIGGGITMKFVGQDTLITEDLIDLVSEGKIPLTIVDSDIAKLNKTYYDNIDISVDVGFPQRSSWAVANDRAWLADSINLWAKTADTEATSKSLLKRYFEISKGNPDIDTATIVSAELNLKDGKISIYDDLFRRYAEPIDYDWRLLAAQAYVESHFDNNVVSWAGARGIMQLMPSTAAAYGCPPDQITNPEACVKAAAASIKDLDRSLVKYVPDRRERIRFIIAAYNAGLGHVYDAIALAKKHDRDPQLWYGNVEECILMKSKPEYYNDPVCRCGYMQGKQTVNYVTKVEQVYERYCAHVALNPSDNSKNKSKSKNKKK